MSGERYRLIGSSASPYALKLRALLRYRRIPHDWVVMTRALRAATAHLRPMLIPVMQFPDGTYRGETTTLAHTLESLHAGRSVIAADPAAAFVCDLLEDMADEWAVKALFLYRWWDPEGSITGCAGSTTPRASTATGARSRTRSPGPPAGCPRSAASST
jgi:hypothetical protein